MKKLILVLFCLLSISSFAQPVTDFFDEYIGFPTNNRVASGAASTYNSERGYNFPSKGTYRMLIIFVNIIYDVTPQYDPQIVNPNWPVTNQEGINQNNNAIAQYYFNEILDVTNISPRQGFLTRFYAEASHDSLIILGDFTSVEIKQSRISPSGESFGYISLSSGVIKYINDSGGLQAHYGHNSISDYDFATCGLNPDISRISNGKLDYVAILVLNPSDRCGDFGPNCGYGGVGSTQKIKLGSTEYSIECGQTSGIGGTLIKNGGGIFTHEFAHSLLGHNNFHTSGGNHLGSNDVATFLFTQQGYGLFTCSAFRSCNAYERWRLGWWNPSNGSHKIGATGINSDIEKSGGTKVFFLRDFVKYGDAIRIKLPFKDSEGASNQYIWLENHQLGRNGKLDGINYHFPQPSCVPLGTPGVYSYIQVGRDVLEGAYGDVYFADEKDNLRMISAEGNFNTEYRGENKDCKNWDDRPTFEFMGDNPLSGSNTKTEAIKTTNLTLQKFSDFTYLGVKIKNDVPFNQLPFIGDVEDAFVAGRIMDISSNPSPINVYTYYARYYSPNSYIKVNDHRDTRKKYLTGLSIKMNYAYTLADGTEVFKVDICWDDFDVKENVNWAGNIVLKEKVNLLSNKIIAFEQNKTVYQINRDPVSGIFAPPTLFTCEANSTFLMYSNSKTVLKDKSSFVMENGSTLTIQNGAELIVESGSTFMLKQGANLIIQGGGKLTVKPGAYICIQSDTNVQLQAYNSIIIMQDGAIYGANPALFSNTNCLSSISFTGSGNIITYNQDVYVQNETISTNRYIGGRNIYVGRNVTATKPIGDVIINNSANVIFDSGQSVNFYDGFEFSSGSSFEIISK
ncbi:MAG: hypothetical protein LBI45_09745 [Bacteroidales bacterium]|nr:hypothetical protein [Bacteroidales bacterium]